MELADPAERGPHPTTGAGERIAPDVVDLFTQARPRLLGLAYRILGSYVEAEDVCQDAWLRWSSADHPGISRPQAWLTTVCTRLALDRLRSAQHRRETYVGPWLPEPVVVSPTPEAEAEMAESLTIGLLSVLERLEPVSRAVFVLADVFGMSFEEVAAIVERTPEATRQIAVRARRKLRSDGRLEPDAAGSRRPGEGVAAHRENSQRLAERLFTAVLGGDVETTLALLAPEVVLTSDGGPNRRAARRPVIGRERVARLVLNIAGRASPDAAYELALFNRSPGVWVNDPILGATVLCVDAIGNQITRIWVVAAPEKLRGPGAVELI